MCGRQGQGVNGVPPESAGVYQEELDLGPYVNTSAATVTETFSIERTYLVFRTMGLRHLVVLDSASRVRGIVTRKARVA